MGKHEEMERAYEAAVSYRVSTGRALLGQPHSAIREQLRAEHEYRTKAFAEVAPTGTGPWFGGVVTITFGLVYGSLKADINFADDYKGHFEGTIWGIGLGAGTGAGGGPWGEGWKHPGNGEEMDFEIVSAGIGGGGTQIFWIKDGTIVGSFLSVNLSVGAFTGGGSGKWKVTKD